MSFDATYSYLIGLAWFFFANWILLLTAACVLAFAGDGLPETAKNDG